MRLGGVEHIVVDDGGRNLCVSRAEPQVKESSKKLLINRLVLFLCCVQLSEWLVGKASSVIW